jgi:acid phosphatase
MKFFNRDSFSPMLLPIKSHLFIFVLFVLLAGCAHQHPLNLSIAKDRVTRYYEGGHYDKDLDAIVKRSIKYFKKISTRYNAAVVFDIDETVLSEYVREKSISFGYVPKLSHEWIMRADAPAIPQVKRLYDYLVKRGFKIIFLTGRKYDEYDASMKNLESQGFTTVEKLIVRQKDEEKLTAQAYKTANRKKLAQEGYRIVGTVGDQRSDFLGGHTGHKVKIPNFRYCIQ